MAYLVYLIISAWLLLTSPAAADPLTIGVTILAGLGQTAINSVVATVLGYAVLGAGYAAAGLLGNGPDVSLTWTQSTSLNAIGANLYRSDTSSVDGDLIATLYASPGVAMAYTDTGAPAASYYTAKPFNGSDFTEGTGTQSGAI